MAATSHLQGFSPLNPFPIDTFPSHPHTHTFFFLDSGTAWLGFQSRFQCLWGLWTRVWAAAPRRSQNRTWEFAQDPIMLKRKRRREEPTSGFK